MGQPLYQQKTNKRTGETAWFRSNDDGSTWSMSDAPATKAPDESSQPEPEAAPEKTAPTTPQAPQMSAREAALVGNRNAFNMGDEASGFGSWLASKVHGETPRTTSRGTNAPLDTRGEYRVGQQLERNLQRRAEHDQPGAYKTAQTATEVAALAPSAMVGAAPLAAATAPALAETVGSSALLSGGVGALSGAGASDSTDPQQIANDAAHSGLVNAALGAAMPLAAGAVRGVGNKVQQFGDFLRGVAAGGGKMTPSEAAAYGRTVNETGLPGVLPKSVHGYEHAADKAAREVGSELRASRAAATAAGKGVSVDDAVQELNGLRDKYLSENTDSGDRKARVIEKELERITGGNKPVDATGDTMLPQDQRQMSVEDLARRAKKLRGPTEGGYPARGDAKTSNTDTTEARKLAKRSAASAYSDLEDRAANDPAARALKDRYGTLSDIQTNAQVQGRPSRLPHNATSLTLYMAENYGADAAAKGAYAAAAPLRAANPTMAGEASTMYSPGVSRAATPEGQGTTRQSDKAVDDPQYGRLIASRPAGEQRDIAYSHLLITDPQFRARERDRAAKQNEEQEE